MRWDEGVALVFREQALAAWRLGGQQWKAWSLRCVSAFLQVDKRPSSRVHLVLVMHPLEQQAGRLFSGSRAHHCLSAIRGDVCSP